MWYTFVKTCVALFLTVTWHLKDALARRRAERHWNPGRSYAWSAAFLWVIAVVAIPARMLGVRREHQQASRLVSPTGVPDQAGAEVQKPPVQRR
jgi:hypothetical protein